VWRGPIVNNAIDRFLMGTAWGALNVLVVDMPPGRTKVQLQSSLHATCMQLVV
jgi:ATP-binding protein involved in chromosome partitioning